MPTKKIQIIGNNLSSTYETKQDAQGKLDEAKAYTDTLIGELNEGFTNALIAMYGEDADGEELLSIREIANDAIANVELITTADIDAICGTTIQVARAEGVTF